MELLREEPGSLAYGTFKGGTGNLSIWNFLGRNRGPLHMGLLREEPGTLAYGTFEGGTGNLCIWNF